MLAFISLGLTACADDDTPAPDGAASDIDAIQSMVVQSCTPDPDYNDCQQTDLDQVRHWTDTLHDPGGPAWRDVQSSSEDELDYEVTIDVHELNGGVISTISNQGQYQSIKHFHAVLSTLLGVDVGTDSFALIVKGSTIKQAEDGGPSTRSYGVFLYDALSDEDGNIFVDGVEVTENYIDKYRTHQQSHQVYASGQSTALETETLATTNGVDTIEDETVLTSGSYPELWEADFRLSWEQERVQPMFPPGNTYWSETSGVRYNGYACLNIWYPASGGGWDSVSRHCNKADTLANSVQGVHAIPFEDNPHNSLQDHKLESLKIGLYLSPLSDTWPGQACALGAAIFDPLNDAAEILETDYIDSIDCELAIQN